MSEKDALSTFKFPKKAGLFTAFEDGEPVKLRVLTTDPLVSPDRWGNTKFSFVVWNHNLQRAQVLSRGTTIAKEIQKLHQDADYGANIRKLDIKITAEGSGLDTSYTVTPLPTTIELTSEQVNECAAIKLEERVEGGQRMSLYKPEEVNLDQSGPEQEIAARDDLPVEQIGDEPINLDDIPF